MQLKPIDQQVVVVVGASSGIGRETALRFAERGAKVVVTARSEPGLRALVNEIRSTGGEAIAVPADVTEFEQIQAVADRAVEAYARIDTWVHLASVGMWATFEQTRPEEFRRIVDVNLTGQAYGAMVALPHLRRTGQGALIHISSVEAVMPLPLQSAYSASKHGVLALLDILRMELAHEGVPISVTNVLPAGINTPFFNKARTKLGVKPKPFPPIYEPEVVAEAILYAAAHPIRTLPVGGGGQMGILSRRIAPRLLSALLQRTAFRLQRTKELKSEDAPHNLFAPIEGHDRSHGDFGAQARGWSLFTWLEMHPPARRILTGVLLGAILLLAQPRRVSGRARKRRSFGRGWWAGCW